jgi:hypothetical protein
MNPKLFCLLFGLVLVGCATMPQQFQAVWTQPGSPPAELAAPVGFTISPAQAHNIVREARILSLKHQWSIYADSQNYCVHDTFLGDSPREAFRHGVRVDGKTGVILKR